MGTTKRDFNYPSADGVTQIHAIEWIPEGEVKAVVQIIHGMVEFIDRYDRFARDLSEHGFYVTGCDLLGHGASVVSDDLHGYFAKENGNGVVIADIEELRRLTAEKYPDVPYFMFGHSMGSFLNRQYITMYGDKLTGAIICGTGYQPEATLKTAKALCRTIALFRGWKYRSRLLNNLSIGSYNKPFEPARTSNDWLTRNTEIVDAYCANPWNNFVFTLNAFYNMFIGLEIAQSAEAIAKIPKKLPVLFVAGGEDPVGSRGEGPKRCAEEYRKAGIADVICKIYPGDRHEILNELDCVQVDRDLMQWMTEKGGL